ncbi:MAG TPA: DUF2155 domain-containing protein [Aliidongia sp.]|nr:DUF2155 domain-containing protein [Aliidongia sp.]
MRRPLLGLAALSMVAAAPVKAPDPPPAPAEPAKITGALLQGLDKTTARVTKFAAPLGQPVKFGTLEIQVRDCRRNPPEEDPESAAYLDIEELRPGETTAQHIFSGWMFASSPALNPLENAIYDVWVLDCSTSSGPAGKKG